MRPRSRRDDAGAAVVDFVLVGVLVTAMFLALLQVGLALHVRNTLTAAAAEGARYAANADRGPGDGAAVARDVITTSLSSRYASDVTAGTEVVDGVATVYVEVRATLPLLGLLGPRSLVARGHALDEEST